MKTRKQIEDLIGEPVSAVSFVMDYVEFHFDGQILRALTNPIVKNSERSIKFGEPGSRDTLCSLIGAAVESIEVREEDAIEMRLSSGYTLVIPLDQDNRTGPEAAHFVPGLDEGILVW